MAQRTAGPDARRAGETRPVRNHLLKWQLQQDRVRLAQLQQRVRRMTAPERPKAPPRVEAEAIRDKSSKCQPELLAREHTRRPPTRTTDAQYRHDPEEDELMQMLSEREQREAATPSRLPRPAVLPPLQRPVHLPRPPSSSSSLTMSSSGLRATGRKLNAAGDFYSPVRPPDSTPSSSVFPPARPTAALKPSGIAAPETTESNHLHVQRAQSTQRYPPYRSEWPLKTPDRWRREALRSNQAEADGSMSVRRRRDQEDAAQADRLLEKAAREADPDALWNDLFYGTKAARARTKQQNDGGSTQPEVYSASSFPEMSSHSKSLSPSSSCYEDKLDDKAKSPEQDDHNYDQQPAPNQQDKLETALPTHETSPTTSAEAVTPTKAFWKLVAVRIGRSEEGKGGEEANVVNRPVDEASSSSSDPNQPSHGAVGQENEKELANVEDDGFFPSHWGLVVLVSCLVGVSGFFAEELMALLGLFTRGVSFSLSRAEQQRMRERLGAVQRELQGFRSAASEIEEHSQKVFDEVKHHLDQMRLDRERHKDLIDKEMNELRSYVLRMTYEMVEQEREAIHARLKETVGIQMMEEEDSVLDAEASEEAESSELSQDSESSEAPEVFEVSDVSHEPLTTVPSTISHPPEDSKSSVTSEEQQPPQLALDSQPLKPSNSPEPSEKSEVLDSMTANSKVEKETSTPALLEDATPLIQDNIHTGGLVAPAVAQHEQVVEVPDLDVLALKTAVTEAGESVDASPVTPMPDVADVAPTSEASRGTTLMSWELSLLVVAIAFLGGCIALRVHNMNRRRKWFEERRQRRYLQELQLARERVRAVVEEAEEHERFEEEENEWESMDADSGVETVALMTPTAESEDDGHYQEEEAALSSWETDEDSLQGSTVYRSYTPMSPEPRRRTIGSARSKSSSARRRRQHSPRR